MTKKKLKLYNWTLNIFARYQLKIQTGLMLRRKSPIKNLQRKQFPRKTENWTYVIKFATRLTLFVNKSMNMCYWLTYDGVSDFFDASYKIIVLDLLKEFLVDKKLHTVL